MIKKVRRPTVRDFRPIALTNVSYKIYMSFTRDEIEKRLVRNKLVRENQIGFTKGGRTEYNHFILQHIVEQVYKEEKKKGKRNRGKKLVLIALDFKKAFDSVNRKGLIKTMIKYRINPEVIDLVAKIYESDSTSI